MSPYVIDRDRLDAANLTPEQKACLNMQEVIQTFAPYYSTIGFKATRTGVAPGPFTYTMAAGTRARAFGYGIDDDMGAGGIPGIAATETDTNISERSKTNGGQYVHIFGIALQWLPESDPKLIEMLYSVLRAKMSLNGVGDGYLLGPLFVFGGSHGLNGLPLGRDLPGLAETTAHRGVYTQSVPQWDNVLQIPEQIVWTPDGSDSNLTIEFATTRALTFIRNDRVGIAPDPVTGFQGVTEYVSPGESQAFAHVRLIGTITGERSKVS